MSLCTLITGGPALLPTQIAPEICVNQSVAVHARFKVCHSIPCVGMEAFKVSGKNNSLDRSKMSQNKNININININKSAMFHFRLDAEKFPRCSQHVI